MFQHYIDLMLEWFPFATHTVNGVAVWVWLLLPISLVLAYILARLLVEVVYLGIRRLTRHLPMMQDALVPARKPLVLFLTTFFFATAQRFMPLGEVKMALMHINTLLYTIATAWVLLIVLNRSTEKLQNYWVRQNNISASALIPLFRKLAQSGVIVMSILFTLQNWGFDIAAMLTALGIGGIALALASQKSMENLFGGVTISLDQPIRIGEFGKYGDLMGTVIDIGLRSTRIKTPQNTIVSIPNADMATLRIENFGPRHQILFTKSLKLRYETTIDEIHTIRQQIQELLTGHPKVVHESVRIRLVDFTDAAQVMEVWSYIDTQNWNEFMELQEMFLLQFRQIIINNGSDLAYPSSNFFIKNMPTEEEAKNQPELLPKKKTLSSV